MSSPFLYFIAIISFLFTQECISFDDENAILANNEKKVEKEKLSKRPYLHSPSSIFTASACTYPKDDQSRTLTTRQICPFQ